MAIELIEVSKKIKGIDIFRKLSYRFEPGKIYGIAGANGSGKTMLLRIMSGMVKVDEGAVKVDGESVRDQIFFPSNMAIVIENLSFDPYLTGFENLRKLAKIKSKIDDQTVLEWLVKIGLAGSENMKYAKYSLGMKQKLALCQAFMEDEKYILLDEPTNALDKQSIINFYEILNEQRNLGKCIIVVSHNEHDLQCVADEIIEVEEYNVRQIEK